MRKTYILTGSKSGRFKFSVDCYILNRVIFFHSSVFCIIVAKSFFLKKTEFWHVPWWNENKSKRQCSSPTSRSRNLEISIVNKHVMKIFDGTVSVHKRWSDTLICTLLKEYYSPYTIFILLAFCQLYLMISIW